jgi:hypothetical protein
MKKWFPTALLAALVIGSSVSRAGAFNLIETTLDLAPLFSAPAKGEPAPEPLFDAMVAADLTGDGRKEIVIPGSDGRLRLLHLTGPLDRLALAPWMTVDTRVEGDRLPGSCYLTAAPLAKGAPASLVLALPRGIFSVGAEGDPPQPRWTPLSDRTFLERGQTASRPQRLDFLVDLDGDGVPEIWIPQLEGMALWHRKADGRSWEEMQTPPMPARARESAGAQRIRETASQPPIYALGFSSVLFFPTIQLNDLNRDGRSEMIVLTRETEKRPRLRAECFALRDSLHFSTSPMQVRTAKADRGSQTFLDLNGDGWLDLLRVESNLDIVNPRTAIAVFLSPPVREYAFDQPTRRYLTHDPVGMVLYGDWNRDGLRDIAYSQFEYTFGSTEDLISLILGREVTVTLRLLHGGRDGFSQKSDQDVRLQIRNRCFNPHVFPPLSMEGDFNGDGVSDLLVRSRLERCEIYLSQSGGRLATRPAETFSMAVEGLWRIGDLDGDGRSDILTFDPDHPSITAHFSRP